MKLKLLLGLLLILSLNCFSQNITKVEVLSVPMDTEMPYSVDCMNYDFAFQNVIDKKTIVGSNAIRRITSVLKNLSVADKSQYPTPDTRMKLRLFSNGKVISEACIGKFTILKDDGVYFYSNDMFNLLNDLLSYKEQKGESEQSEPKLEFNTVKQYKGFLGAAMGTISFDNENNFLYDIDGSILKEKLLGTFTIDDNIIDCTVSKSYNDVFEKGDKLKFMIKSDTLFQYNSEQEPDRNRPLLRIR